VKARGGPGIGSHEGCRTHVTGETVPLLVALEGSENQPVGGKRKREREREKERTGSLVFNKTYLIAKQKEELSKQRKQTWEGPQEWKRSSHL
jgi:hypothetical protein